MKPIMSQSVFAQGIKKKKSAESGMPTMIHGIRRPYRVNVLLTKCTDERLKDDTEDVIDRHDGADDRRGEHETLFKKDRHQAVVQAPSQ